ncbi:MAG: nodulation protein NfeD [Pseudomonadota bacterium]
MRIMTRPRGTSRQTLAGWILCSALLLAFLPWTEAATGQERTGVVLDLSGAIGPAGADYVSRGIEDARKAGAGLVILRMDTPGGLDASMRDIIRAILASPVPVASFVAPGGARAASAGTYILYASHIAAMAPGTTVGAATPVKISGMPGLPEPGKPPADGAEPATSPPDDAMKRKLTSDAAAYLRGLAALRGRNTEWAELAVREGASLSAEEALVLGVVDLIATDLGDLLRQLDGRMVRLEQGEVTLQTAGLALETRPPDWRSRLLAVITDPNMAYILLLIGIYGLIMEFANPGSILPGVAGAICLVLALYALQVLPINYAGLMLMLLGIAFMVGEIFTPSFGVLGLGGVAAFVTGSLILFEGEGLSVSLPLVGGMAMLSALVVFWVVGTLARLRRRPVVTGMEEFPGTRGEAEEEFLEGRGHVRIHGESWLAECASPVRKGQQVRVRGMEGLVLKVEPFHEEP